jgi:quinol monooxygenase YgiN
MIVRLVWLPLKDSEKERFEVLFQNIRNNIQNFKGCMMLDLLKQDKNGSDYFTYSTWISEDALNHYLKSDFFSKVWPDVKLMLRQKAMAWTLVK